MLVSKGEEATVTRGVYPVVTMVMQLKNQAEPALSHGGTDVMAKDPSQGLGDVQDSLKVPLNDSSDITVCRVGDLAHQGLQGHTSASKVAYTEVVSLSSTVKSVAEGHKVDN